jgi:glutamate-1-semialdehyde aminotransferase
MVGLKRALNNEGVDLMSDGRIIVGAAHTDDDLQATIDAFRRALIQMQEEEIV